jgi:hypothetical protein
MSKARKCHKQKIYLTNNCGVKDDDLLAGGVRAAQVILCQETKNVYVSFLMSFPFLIKLEVFSHMCSTLVALSNPNHHTKAPTSKHHSQLIFYPVNTS